MRAAQAAGRVARAHQPPTAAIDALTYLVNGFATMLAPGFTAHLGAWIGLPTIVAEGSLCLWLLVAGVNVERWQEQASAAIRIRVTQVEELA